MAGEIASAAISGGSGLLGNILGWFSNKNTNKTNLKINQMNNEFNEKMMERQLAYNTDMWNKQNEYNDPSAQVERLKRAGINPVMAMQGNPSNTAASAMGVNPASASSAAPQQAWQPSMEGIAQGAQMLYNRERQQAEIHNIYQDTYQKAIDNMTRNARNMEELRFLRSQTRSNDQKANIDRQMFILNQRQMNQDFNLALQQERVNQLTMRGIRLDNIVKELNATNLPMVIKYNLAQRIADIALTKNKYRTEGYNQGKILQEIMESTARELGYTLDNKQKQDTMPILKSILNTQDKWQWFDKLTQNVSNLFSAFSNAKGKSTTINSPQTHTHQHRTTINNQR